MYQKGFLFKKWVIFSCLLLGLTVVAPVLAVETGKFKLIIIPDSNPEHKKIMARLHKHRALEKIVEALNATLTIPCDVNIILASDPRGLAYYSFGNKDIHLSYEDIEQTINLSRIFHPQMDEEAFDHYIVNNLRYTLYHELGHCLVDLYHLPKFGGKSEDVADAFAAVLALNYIRKGYYILLNSADYYSMRAQLIKDDKISNELLWDDHSLDQQRYFQLVCYAYGKYPKQVKSLSDSYFNDVDLKKMLTDQKIQKKCEGLYSEVLNSWLRFLEPHLKISVDTSIDNQENN